MNDFDWDVLQKKRIARSAKYMNRKKPGCRLPSDNMTEAQKRKMNGEVKTLNLNEPITWEQFKKLSKQMQEEYIAHVMGRFGVRCGAIAQAVGISQNVWCRYLAENGVKYERSKGRAKRDYQDRVARMMEWATGEDASENERDNTIERSVPAELIREPEQITATVKDPEPKDESGRFQIDVKFVGTLADLNRIARWDKLVELHIVSLVPAMA